MSFKNIALYLLVILALILVACQAPPASPEPIVETLVVTEVVEATPVETIHVVTPTPEPEGPRTLVICMSREPDTLYPFNDDFATLQVLEAVAEGGWSAFDDNSFGYQPVILEKLPSLSDGDAALAVVTVSESDRVVDANNEVVILNPAADPPIMLISAGGGAPQSYQGGEFEMEQLSVTFKLLPNLQWSDGEPLTAHDSVYAFNLLADPDSLGDKTKIEPTASYQAIDELTTMWTGLPGFRDAEYFTNFFSPVPEHVWSQYPVDELSETEEIARTPVGWGPYVIGEWLQNESITLHKNPNYFRAAEGLPKVDTVVYRFVGEDSNTNIAALLSGECDIVSAPLDRDLLLDLHNSGRVKASFTTGTIWEHLDFGIQPREYDDGYQMGVDRPDFFSDVRTRRAFAMCMDRQALVEELTFGQSLVIDSYLPPQHPLYNPDVRHYEFDVAAGSALLEEIGWMDDDGDPETPRVAMEVANVPDGTPLEVDLETVTRRSQIVAILQESLAQCGIQANIQTYAFTDWFADGPEGKLFGRKFDLSVFAWLTGAKPPCDLYLSTQIAGPAGETWVSIQDGEERSFGFTDWDGDNNPGFANQEYDAACSTALGTLQGQDDYEAAQLEAQRIFAEQLPVVPLFLGIKEAAARPDLCGLIVDPTNNSLFWNIEEFDYGEGCEE